MGGMTHCANCGAEVPVDMPHRVGECNHPPMTITDFILARIADDEVVWRPEVNDLVMGGIAERMLAEVEVKRRIVEMHTEGPRQADPCDAHDGATMETVPCDTLRVLALPYADHPDYDESWRP